jgi:Glycosyl hydrolase catalytic core
VPKRFLGVCAALCAVVAIGAPSATPSSHMLVGILDESSAVYGNPDKTFPILGQLKVQVLRINIYWYRVAKTRPTDATDPADPAYDWGVYDRTAQYANQYKIKLLVTIWGTPHWENGKTPRYAPKNPKDLQKFAYAAATRYSGTYLGDDGRTLPAVRYWTAWNEPNQVFQLYPQYVKVRGKFITQSAIDYVKICHAVYDGVHSTLLGAEKVACGVTAPRGNNIATGKRGSPDPMSFMRAVKKAGLKRFDAWAHHPYYNKPSETPTSTGGPRSIELGSINKLIAQLTAFWGPKRVWLTEYGWQSNPPDKLQGVSLAKQAAYLKQSYLIARKNPRIDMFVWFLLKDERVLSGWQSGLMTASGKKKPAFNTFMHLKG